MVQSLARASHNHLVNGDFSFIQPGNPDTLESRDAKDVLGGSLHFFFITPQAHMEFVVSWNNNVCTAPDQIRLTHLEPSRMQGSIAGGSDEPDRVIFKSGPIAGPRRL